MRAGRGDTAAMGYVLTEISDGVARLTLNDPDKRNAVSKAMNDEIAAVLDELEADPSVGAVVVTGAGKGFCSGADLSDLNHASQTDNAAVTLLYDGFLRVAHSPLATVAAVNGAAVGAGMNMVLACDIAVAGRQWARFDSRFLQIGLHPGGGHTWRLNHIVGRTTTMAMVLFGEVLRAEDAQRAGLVWDVVDDDALLDRAHELAARAAGQPKELVARTKATILSLDDITGSDQAVAHEVEPQLWSLNQPIFRELLSKLRDRTSSGR